MCGMMNSQKPRMNNGQRPLMDKWNAKATPFIDRVNAGKVTGKPVNNIQPPSEGNPKLPRFGQP